MQVNPSPRSKLDRPHLIYDLPTRIFHWLFLGLFVLALLLAKTGEQGTTAFSFHMMAGLGLGFLLGLRLIWGLVGTRHARFSDFRLHPRALAAYIRGGLKATTGHNPASSWSSVLMMLLAAGLAITGWMQATGSTGERLAGFHELMANGFMLIALAHVAGITFHTLRRSERLALSMIDGRKAQGSPADEIASSRRPYGFALLAVFAAFAAYLLVRFDREEHSLQLLGQSLDLSAPDHGLESESET